MKIADRDTLVIAVGGNAGSVAGAAVAGAVSGAASLTGANRSMANIVSKVLFGVGMLAASEKVRSPDIKLMLEGAGTAPLYTLADEAIAAAVPGTNVADYVYAEVQKLLNPTAGAGFRGARVAYSTIAQQPGRPLVRNTATLGV